MRKCTNPFGHIFNRTGIQQGGQEVKSKEHHKLLHQTHTRHVHLSTCVFCGATKRKVDYGD